MRFVEPVTSHLAADGTLRGQTGAVARRAVEGLIYLCWMRSGIAGLIAGGVIAATHSSQGDACHWPVGRRVRVVLAACLHDPSDPAVGPPAKVWFRAPGSRADAR